MECAARYRHLCLQAGVLSLMRALGSMIMLRCACNFFISCSSGSMMWCLHARVLSVSRSATRGAHSTPRLCSGLFGLFAHRTPTWCSRPRRARARPPSPAASQRRCGAACRARWATACSTASRRAWRSARRSSGRSEPVLTLCSSMTVACLYFSSLLPSFGTQHGIVLATRLVLLLAPCVACLSKASVN